MLEKRSILQDELGAYGEEFLGVLCNARDKKSRMKIASTMFFPCVICAEFDSPIDALISLCVPLDEARDLVAASCLRASDENPTGACLITQINGGRSVAALRTSAGRWAACNAFLHQATASQREAERVLNSLLKRGRRGLIGVMFEVK